MTVGDFIMSINEPPRIRRAYAALDIEQVKTTS
jgi:hypothetical protein